MGRQWGPDKAGRGCRRPSRRGANGRGSRCQMCRHCREGHRHGGESRRVGKWQGAGTRGRGAGKHRHRSQAAREARGGERGPEAGAKSLDSPATCPPLPVPMLLLALLPCGVEGANLR